MVQPSDRDALAAVYRHEAATLGDQAAVVGAQAPQAAAEGAPRGVAAGPAAAVVDVAAGVPTQPSYWGGFSLFSGDSMRAGIAGLAPTGDPLHSFTNVLQQGAGADDGEASPLQRQQQASAVAGLLASLNL